MEISSSFPSGTEKREHPVDVTDADGVNVMELDVRSAPSQMKRTSLTLVDVLNFLVIREVLSK